MKKILFGSAAVLCAAVGLSSFKTVANRFDVHYFKIISGSGSQTKFVNTQVQSLGTSIDVASEYSCSDQVLSNKCVVTFAEAKLTGIGVATILKTGGLNPSSQANNAIVYYRSAQ